MKRKHKFKQLIRMIKGLFFFIVTVMFVSTLAYAKGGWYSGKVHEHTFGADGEYYGLGVESMCTSTLIGLDGTIYTVLEKGGVRKGGGNFVLCAIDPKAFDNDSCKWSFDLRPFDNNSHILGVLDMSMGNNGDIYLTVAGVEKTSFSEEEPRSEPSYAPYLYIEAINTNTTSLKWSSKLHFTRPNEIDDYLYRIVGDECAGTIFKDAIGPDGAIYVGSSDGNVYTIDPNTGEEKSLVKLNDNITEVISIDKNGRLYIVGYNLVSEEGKDKIPEDLGEEGSSYEYKIDNSTLYVIDLNLLDGSASISWRKNFDNIIYPIVGNHVVYVIDLDRKSEHIMGIDPKTGKEKWYDTNNVFYARSMPVIGKNDYLYFAGRSLPYNRIYKMNECIYSINPDNGSVRCVLSLEEENIDDSHYNFSGDVRGLSIDANGNLDAVGYFEFYNPDNDTTFRYNFLVISDNGSIVYKNAIGDRSEEGYLNASPSSFNISEKGTVYFLGESEADDSAHMWAIDSDAKGFADTPWPKFGYDSRNTSCAMKYYKDPNSSKPVYAASNKGEVKNVMIHKAEDNETIIASHPVRVSPSKIIAFSVDNITPGDSVTVNLYNISAPDNASFYKYVNGSWYNLENNEECDNCSFSYTKNPDGTYNISFTVRDGEVLDADGEKNGVIVDPVVVGRSVAESSPEPSSSNGGGCTTSDSASVGLMFILLAAIGFAVTRKLSLVKKKDN